jgi:CRP-like cAMP-binding protein
VPKLDRDARRAALRGCPLFEAVEPAELDAILDLASERKWKRGQTIFQQGDEGSSMMAVLSGTVRIGAVSAEGREVTLNTIGQGEVFGEIALLDGKPRSADATAMEDTTLLIVERRHFLPFLSANQDLTLRLLAVLCDRLRETSETLGDLVMFELPGRLARLLIKLAADHGRRTEAGLRIDFKLSQRDLGTRVASSRESVNKQLGAWRDDGLLHLDHGYITLLQPDRFKRLLAED